GGTHLHEGGELGHGRELVHLERLRSGVLEFVPRPTPPAPLGAAVVERGESAAHARAHRLLIHLTSLLPLALGTGTGAERSLPESAGARTSRVGASDVRSARRTERGHAGVLRRASGRIAVPARTRIDARRRSRVRRSGGRRSRRLR